jgi:cathepsin X
MILFTISLLLSLSKITAIKKTYPNELFLPPGDHVQEIIKSPLPHTYIKSYELPLNFRWDDINGKNFLTKNLNQHVPQYCGSCWAHAALSSMADRIKILRDSKGLDINLSVQAILNCAVNTAGTCHGGDAKALYEWATSNVIPYDTCLQYIATDESCEPINICRTCDSFDVECAPVTAYPNATISEFGSVKGEFNMMAEIYARGPIPCDIDSGPLHEYLGGILDCPEPSDATNHVISIIGWGETDSGLPYWIGRNSWGEYWGEQGWFRIVRGENQLLIESNCAWGVPGSWTDLHSTKFTETAVNFNDIKLTADQ